VWALWVVGDGSGRRVGDTLPGSSGGLVPLAAGLRRQRSVASRKRHPTGPWSRLLPSSVARPVQDELVGGGLQPVDRGLRQEGVGHQRELLDRFPVRRGDGGGFAVSFYDEFIDVSGVEAVHRLQREIVEDEQLDA